LFADAGEESGKGEDDEWESQQIRKGVSGAQVGSCTLVIFPRSNISWPCVEVFGVIIPYSLLGGVLSHDAVLSHFKAWFPLACLSLITFTLEEKYRVDHTLQSCFVINKI
jgi:hypothetical protein